MKIKQELLGDIVVVSLDGNLFGEPEISEVRKEIYTVLERGLTKVVLDLSKVNKMNSSGLGTIMAILASIKVKGGELRLANITGHVGSALALTKLVKVLKIYETVGRAVKGF
jgi:anti-sigma B factor antagonist